MSHGIITPTDCNAMDYWKVAKSIDRMTASFNWVIPFNTFFVLIVYIFAPQKAFSKHLKFIHMQYIHI